MFYAHPIGAGESGGSFGDFLEGIKNVISMPLKLATMPLQLIKSAVMGSGVGHSKAAPKSKQKKVASADHIYTQVNKKPKDQQESSYVDIGEVAPVVLPQLGRVIIEPIHTAADHTVKNNNTVYKIPFADGNGKPRKARAKKGGNLLSTLSDMANIMPSVFGTELDNWIPPEVARGIAKSIGEKAMGGAKKVRKTNPWLEHVKAVKSKHSGMKYKDVLILAKQSYHK
jgi:hypothetical protein